MKLDSFFKLYLTTRRIYRHIARAFFQNGYDCLPEHFIILMLLNQKKTMKQNEIKLQTIQNKTMLTRAIDKLVGRDLVKRTMDLEDRRANILEITDKGKTVFTQLERIYGNIMNKAQKGVSQEDMDTVLESLARILATIEQ